MSHSKGTILAILTPFALSFFLYLLLPESQQMAWEAPSLSHPLGTDEFGRNILITGIIATGFSLVKGLAMASTTLIMALLLAEFMTLSSNKYLPGIVRVAANVVESVPTVLWVMIVVIVIREPRYIVVPAAFTLVTLPSALYITAGELLRIRNTPYVEAAYLLGSGELRVLLGSILPNSVSVLAPYALMVLGAAIAVDGAIGVIGLGNRSDLDLGIFLLRGKENFILHPQLLIMAILIYSLIYGYLLWIGQQMKRVFNDGNAEHSRCQTPDSIK